MQRNIWIRDWIAAMVVLLLTISTARAQDWAKRHVQAYQP